jgi:hypothetical protein
MSMLKRRTWVGWCTLLACAVFLLVSTGASSSYAQTSGSPSKSSGTLEDGAGTTAGDPDMPSGDLPPPGSSGSTSSYDGGGIRGHAATGTITEAVPSKRFGLWAHWKIALKILARNFYLR